jgi:hypothetical protein
MSIPIYLRFLFFAHHNAQSPHCRSVLVLNCYHWHFFPDHLESIDVCDLSSDKINNLFINKNGKDCVSCKSQISILSLLTLICLQSR